MPNREYAGKVFQSWTPSLWDEASPELQALGVDPEELKRKIASARSGAGQGPKVSDYGYTPDMPEEYGFLNWLINEYMTGAPKVKSPQRAQNSGWPEGVERGSSRYM